MTSPNDFPRRIDSQESEQDESLEGLTSDFVVAVNSFLMKRQEEQLSCYETDEPYVNDSFEPLVSDMDAALFSLPYYQKAMYEHYCTEVFEIAGYCTLFDQFSDEHDDRNAVVASVRLTNITNQATGTEVEQDGLQVLADGTVQQLNESGNLVTVTDPALVVHALRLLDDHISSGQSSQVI